MFAMVAIQMKIRCNNSYNFPNIDGRDIARDFELHRRPHFINALEAKIPDLKKRRKTAKAKESVRINRKASINMEEAQTKTDAKEWAAAHNAELNRHDTELCTWIYEDAFP